MTCRCRDGLGGCMDGDIGDGGMCHYCSHVCTGLMTNVEYWTKFYPHLMEDQ